MEDLGSFDFSESKTPHVQLSALTNAALVTRWVSSCTLGPIDLNTIISAHPPNNVETIHKENQDYCNNITEICNQKVMDYDQLNKTIAYKNHEEIRKENVKAELNQRETDLLSEFETRRYTAAKLCEEARNATLTRKIDNEKVIATQFEERMMKELNDIENSLRKQNEQTCVALESFKKNSAHLQLRLCYFTILTYQKKFKEIYEQVAHLLMSTDKRQLPISEDINKQLHSLIAHYDKLLQKIKSQEISSYEVQVAEYLVRTIENIEETLKTEIRKIQTETLKCTSNDKKIYSEVPSKVLENKESHTNSSDGQEIQSNNSYVAKEIQSIEANTTDVIRYNDECLQFYNNIMDFYKIKIESVKALQADNNFKKYRSSCQKAINIPINAISAVNPQHLQDKYDKLYNLLSGIVVKIPDGTVSSTEHPQGRDFCMLSLAKKFVGQGDSTVSSNAQAAFPIACIIVEIWKKYPDFGKLFLAYTFKESPYLVPYFVPQLEGQSTVDYYKTIGYRIKEDVFEKQDMYLKRQAGLMRLYAAIMVSEPRSRNDQDRIHPYGIENGWKWLCNMLNLEPLPDICATLILEFLQTAGHEMWRTYGNQFTKILNVIQKQYFQKLSKVDEGGPKARLEVFISKVMEEKHIEKPQGLLPPNFW